MAKVLGFDFTKHFTKTFLSPYEASESWHLSLGESGKNRGGFGGDGDDDDGGWG